MLHSTVALRSSLRVPDGQELEDQILMRRLQRPKPKKYFSLKALTASRLQGYVAGGGILVAAAVFLGPWMWEEFQEMLGYKYVPLPPSHMPRTSPEWWENEWRKMNPLWRVGESVPDFFVGSYRFVKQQTGRDLSSAYDFVRTSPSSSSASVSSTKPHGLLYRLTHLLTIAPSSSLPGSSSTGLSSTVAGSQRGTTALRVHPAPQMLVPLCGDSPIMRTAALQGFEVDAVDSSQTAIQTAVNRTEEGLPYALYPHIHLHWKNFFAPELWDGSLKDKKFDVIYERQGMTSLNREQRADYAYLLKRALKNDGLIYVEGIFRTGRVKGNKLMGPPYSLSKRELEQLFPVSEGYYVRCEEKTDAMQQLSRENRILKRVPKELYVTPFNCVVFREDAVNLKTRSEPLQHPEPPTLSPPPEGFSW